jgi:tetratricopeptide (TPR) repeat protein
LRDCSTALTLNSQCSKALYRSTLALIALERYEEALDCCSKCLAFDSDNKAIAQLQEKAKRLKVIKDEKERVREERLQKEREAKRKLEIAFKVTKLSVH